MANPLGPQFLVNMLFSCLSIHCGPISHCLLKKGAKQGTKPCADQAASLLKSDVTKPPSRIQKCRSSLHLLHFAVLVVYRLNLQISASESAVASFLFWRSHRKKGCVTLTHVRDTIHSFVWPFPLLDFPRVSSIISTRHMKLPNMMPTSSTARGGAGSFKKVDNIYPEEHVPLESFVTTLIDEPFSDDMNKVGIYWLCRSTQLHATASSRRRLVST